MRSSRRPPVTREKPRPKVPAPARTASRDPHSKTLARLSAGCAVLTVSDTRGPGEDRSGARAQALLEAAGHRVVARRWVHDERAAMKHAALVLLRRRDVDVVLVTGGTGVAPRDVTPEALEALYAKPLPGFGERFRARSEAQVGSAAWLSRASAGVARGRLLVLLPGSTRAVELALQELLLPELSHLLRLMGRTPDQE